MVYYYANLVVKEKDLSLWFNKLYEKKTNQPTFSPPRKRARNSGFKRYELNPRYIYNYYYFYFLKQLIF